MWPHRHWRALRRPESRCSAAQLVARAICTRRGHKGLTPRWGQLESPAASSNPQSCGYGSPAGQARLPHIPHTQLRRAPACSKPERHAETQETTARSGVRTQARGRAGEVPGTRGARALGRPAAVTAGQQHHVAPPGQARGVPGFLDLHLERWPVPERENHLGRLSVPLRGDEDRVGPGSCAPTGGFLPEPAAGFFPSVRRSRWDHSIHKGRNPSNPERLAQLCSSHDATGQHMPPRSDPKPRFSCNPESTGRPFGGQQTQRSHCTPGPVGHREGTRPPVSTGRRSLSDGLQSRLLGASKSLSEPWLVWPNG